MVVECGNSKEERFVIRGYIAANKLFVCFFMCLTFFTVCTCKDLISLLEISFS